MSFDISFLPSDEIVLKADRTSKSSSDQDIEAALKTLKPSIATATNAKHLASTIQLCSLDPSLNILRRELDDTSNGGWNQVAAKAAAPRRAPTQAAVGVKSVYTVLGSKMAEAKKKKKEKEREREEVLVVDDWEEEVRKEEEAERVASGGEENTGMDGKDVKQDEDVKPEDTVDQSNIGTQDAERIASSAEEGSVDGESAEESRKVARGDELAQNTDVLEEKHGMLQQDVAIQADGQSDVAPL